MTHAAWVKTAAPEPMPRRGGPGRDSAVRAQRAPHTTHPGGGAARVTVPSDPGAHEPRLRGSAASPFGYAAATHRAGGSEAGSGGAGHDDTVGRARPEPMRDRWPSVSEVERSAAGAPPRWSFADIDIHSPLPQARYGSIQRQCRGCEEASSRGNEPPQAQTSLKISEPGDRYEQEADRVADRVVRSFDADGVAASGVAPMEVPLSTLSSSRSQIQREARDEDPAAQGAQAPSPETKADEPPTEQDLLLVPDEEGVGADTGSGVAGEAPLDGFLASSRGSGAPLQESVRRDMEHHIGADFSSVRIHTDSRAAEASRRLNAHAFTLGNDIYFGQGKFAPGSRVGQHILAHELAHTMQQSGSTIHRLAITPVGTLTTGSCGGHRMRWDFTLSSGAPADGYIVQKVDLYEDIRECPRFGVCPASPKLTFWEAWKVAAGATQFRQHATIGFTDQSSFTSRPATTGDKTALGSVKFFLQSVTGDLGDLDAGPATPNGGWARNGSGRSGRLPSTLTEPSWWSGTPAEGTGSRGTWASWRCCNSSSDFNTIRADPQ